MRLKSADVLVALHATRSHSAIRRWRDTRGDKPLVLILTGTDLYRDLPGNDAARESLQLADRLVLLQAQALYELPIELRHKARVIYQSAPTLPGIAKYRDQLHCIFVGHLRSEKDPLTALKAWRYLPRHLPITLSLVGAALDAELARAVTAASRKDHRIRWVGPKPHAWTLCAIQHSHLLLSTSRMEGGAHVLAEAVRAGAAVAASRMSGNVGMMGTSYSGYFDVGDACGLAALLTDCLVRPRIYDGLLGRCLRRQYLFSPARECHGVRQLMREVLEGHKMGSMEDS